MRLTTHAVVALLNTGHYDAVLEIPFTAAVIDLAKLRGWRTAHFRPAKTERGWRTAVQGDGAGFPDLILTRRDRLIAAELKSEGNKAKADQLAWLTAFSNAGTETYIWFPRDWLDIKRILK